MSEAKKTTKAATEAVAKTQETVSGAASALSTSATAYVNGVTALAKTFYGIGQEVAQEAVEHGKSSVKAKCVKDLAEMQAGYVQHRLETSSVHVKTVADVAAENLKNVYAPLLGLLKDRKAA